MQPDVNPYAPPQAQTQRHVACHRWNGREITIFGTILASRLWLVIGYTITIDGRQSFFTAQRSSTEDFKWKFDHHGKLVEGHFTTFGWNGIRRQYNLTIDGEELGPGNVPMTGWWGVLIVWPLILLAQGLLVYMLF